MAKVEIRVHSDFTDQAEPIVEALELVANAVEGYYGYITGCVGLNEENYVAMLWASNHLSGLISQTRPVTYPYNGEQQDSKTHHSPYPPYNPYTKD